jgi:hypothetical protein
MNIEILRKGNHCINSYASKKRRRLIKHSSSVLCGHILTKLASFKKLYVKNSFHSMQKKNVFTFGHDLF